MQGQFLFAGSLFSPLQFFQNHLVDFVDVTAAHGDDHVHRGNIREQLGALALFHVDAVKLFHEPHRVRIDGGFERRARGIALKGVARQRMSERLRDLAAAGIVDADERNPGFHQRPRSLLRMVATSSRLSTLP